ncbi:TPA: hypothetical protein DEP21_04790 [Patescibacteria group bacterium]|nr:hypothetical protein [Candidatus Gracilibacteria bacterium]
MKYSTKKIYKMKKKIVYLYNELEFSTLGKEVISEKVIPFLTEDLSIEVFTNFNLFPEKTIEQGLNISNPVEKDQHFIEIGKTILQSEKETILGAAAVIIILDSISNIEGITDKIKLAVNNSIPILILCCDERYIKKNQYPYLKHILNNSLATISIDVIEHYESDKKKDYCKICASLEEIKNILKGYLFKKQSHAV